MEIIIDRTNEERQSAIVTIDMYSLRDALELALKLGVFGQQTQEFKSESK